ncbi:alpha/beta hydrolase [Nocardiopsis quinghaiensis]|uniref:alpha/beta hydrolase n=1 Tax=Nocardiopsis quinghaiensis TaxID=464995 RepID=UPI0012395779|nr:alpha/beta hydrolase [Nocardiopsis quinghaiensis]
MSPEYMVLGLPEDVDANEGAIRDSASDLLTTRNTMLGRSADLETGFSATANEFSDTIAWDIREASDQEIQTWEEAAEILTHGSGTLTLYADAVKKYRGVRVDLHLRWSECKREALARIEELGADTLTFSGVSQEQAEVDYLNGVREGLLGEHTQARSDLDDATDEAKDALTNGPSAASWKRIEDAGLMTGREIHLFGGVPDPAVDFEPQEGWTPEEVAQWWSTLAPNQWEHAMSEYPDDLRNLDGVPVVVRNELNRAALEEAIGHFSSPGVGGDPFTLEQLREIQEATKGDDDKFLIYFDPFAPGGGQAALSTGNPDLADHVSTMVPGMFNDMGTLATPIERSEALHAQMAENDPNGEHASITWMGYNAPPTHWDSRDGATALASFQEGLRATHQGDAPSHNTVLGHSYGAYIAGAAANPHIGGGLDVDSLVFVGGAGASVDHISDLTVDEENVHVIQGDDDWIENARDDFGLLIEGFGTPLHHDEFFEDPDTPGGELGNRLDPEADTDHSGYFTDEETLGYLGEVLTGGTPQ